MAASIPNKHLTTAARCHMTCASRSSSALRRSGGVAAPMRCARADRARAVAVAAGLRARWLLDARYGCKSDATILLVEWVQTVGAQAAGGADLLSRARVSTGALGAPESRLELELGFASMAEWEAFLARIPPAAHKAWSQRVASMVVDGSPRWEVFREVEVAAAPAGAASGSVSDFNSSSSSSSGSSSSSSAAGINTSSSAGISSGKLVFADKVLPEDVALFERGDARRQEEQAVAGTRGGDSDGSGSGGGDSDNDGGGVMLDWKGEPLKVSPGDKLPGIKFL